MAGLLHKQARFPTTSMSCAPASAIAADRTALPEELPPRPNFAEAHPDLRFPPVAGRELRVAPRQPCQLCPPPLAVFAVRQDQELVGVVAIMRRPFRAGPRIGPALRA